MLLVEDLMQSNLPKAFLDLLPVECPHCGEPTNITETLSTLSCSSPSCVSKSVQRMVSMLSDLQVKGMGASKCEAFLNHFGVTNPYYIIAYDPYADGELYEGCSMDFSIDIYNQIRNATNLKLWEFVKVGNLEGIQTSAQLLFGEYDDLDDFYSDLEQYGISFVQQLLGINESTVSVRATKIYHTLMSVQDEFRVGLPYVNIIPFDDGLDSELPTFHVYVSDWAGLDANGEDYGKKKDYMNFILEKFDGKVANIKFESTFSTRVCNVLVWSGEGEPTKKVEAVIKRNEKLRKSNIDKGLDEEEGLTLLCSGREFEAFLASLE